MGSKETWALEGQQRRGENTDRASVMMCRWIQGYAVEQLELRERSDAGDKDLEITSNNQHVKNS